MVVAALLTILCIILLAPVNNQLAQAGSGGIFSLQFSFTHERFMKVITGWGNDGIATFLKTMWIDYLFPIFYATLLGSIQARVLLRKVHPVTLTQHILIAIPYAAALFDYMENTLHVILLSQPAPYSSTLILAASMCASIKWALIFVSIVSISYSLRTPTRGEKA